MKRFAPITLAALVLAGCQDATTPELTAPQVSPVYTAVPVNTFTVTNTNDAGPGSLRQAILDANGSAGYDAIEFGIPAATDPGCNPGTGVCTIQPIGSLPIVTDPVVIDGYTQPGASPNTNPVGIGLNTVLKIEIDGSLLTGAAPIALVIRTEDTTVRGLVINRVSPGTLNCCPVGIDLTHAGSSPTIGNNIVEGNFIGTDVDGAMAFGSAAIGAGVNVATGNNRIGGTTPAARNLIHGNSVGIAIAGGFTDGNVVQGNLIGTAVDGAVALGNITRGVVLGCGAGTDNLVGGTAPGARNVISGTGGHGVLLCLADGNGVQGNFIGTDITGTVALGGGSVGIDVADNNMIGDTVPGGGNVILQVSITGGSTGNRVEGNFIGTDETGSINLGNQSYGVTIHNSPSNTIGGTVPGAGNTIAYNGQAGVWVRTGASTGNAILSNAIFANDAVAPGSGLGIDLGSPSFFDGVTPNDPGDGDTGANNLQNFPVITSSFTGGGTVTVEGTLNSTASTTFRLEFFANSVADPSGHGEGETFVGSTMVTTDASGDASFDATFSASVPAGQFVTATATDPDGNTSEFSGVREAEPGRVVAINIKPGSDPNSINLGSNGVIPVAIFSTADFDATTVDPGTVTLADAAVKVKGNGTPLASLEDVNGDGLLDMVVHVETTGLALTEGETEAVLEGATLDGTPITGTDSVRVVP